MYADILRGIIGIEVFPVLSLVIFTTFFAGVIVRVARMTRPQIDHLSRLPLEHGGRQPVGPGVTGQEASR